MFKAVINSAKKMWNSIPYIWKDKSFAFAFWGVFVLGSILVGFFSRVYHLVMNVANAPNMIRYPFGYLSLWGYIEFSYLTFSIIYVYRKSNLLTVNNRAKTKVFLLIYICSSVIIYKFSWYYSILDLLGNSIYDLVTGSRSVAAFFYALGKYYGFN